MNHRAPSILAMVTTMLALDAPRALAHPGHGLDATGVGLLHFLFQPGHGGISLVVALTVVIASITVRRRRHG